MESTQRVLFIDDELAVRSAFARFMRARGIDVDMAGGTREAMDMVRTHGYSVVLSDLRMPDGDGLELIGRLRQIQPDATYMLVTGSLESVNADDSTHGIEVIAKPWDPKRLTETVCRALETANQDAVGTLRYRLLVLDSIEGIHRPQQKLRAAAKQADVDLLWAKNEAHAVELMDEGLHAVLLPLWACADNELSVIQKLTAAAPTVPIIAINDESTDDLTMQALDMGAEDYIQESELHGASLVRMIRHAIDKKRTDERVAYLEDRNLPSTWHAQDSDPETQRQFLSDLAMALRKQQFLLHYQPKVCLRTGAIVGAEALIRWQHPQHGLISPAVFIPALESTGGIVAVGQWVVQQVCAQIKEWLAQGLALKSIALNVSARQLTEGNFVHVVDQALQQSGIAPELLELEITESLFMSDKDAPMGLLDELRAKGVRLALDDFGTGYSSLSYLTRFPIHTLKLDRSFVKNLHASAKNAAICRAIINLGHALDLEVVAEGVETEAQQVFLAEAGCDVFQGFLFSKPITPAAVAIMMHDEQRESA